MSTTYDDMLSRAAWDMLIDIPEIKPHRDKVWVVEESIRTVFHKAEDAAAMAERVRAEFPCVLVEVFQLEVQ